MIVGIIMYMYAFSVQVSVEVLSVLRVEEEVATAYSGDNIKLRLKGIEEEVGYSVWLVVDNIAFHCCSTCSSGNYLSIP